ncbi:MAG: hypothetical protein IPP48_15870 [Chitinophagaceae bacterium]|nr:hypothetical protein [Chitinophagaceae bacterium]
MIWQFGELANATSIFSCNNGTIPQPYGNGQCKLESKPASWPLLQQAARKQLYNVVASLNRLKQLSQMHFIYHYFGQFGQRFKKGFNY